MAATALTILAHSNPATASDGTVGTLTSPVSGSNKGIDWTGVQKGVKFSITLTNSAASVAAESVAVTESATGYDINVTMRDNGVSSTSTANQVRAAVAADPVASLIVVGANHAGNDGTGVIAATVVKASSTGEAQPTVWPNGTLAAADTVNGNTWVNTGNELLLIDNTDAGPSQVLLTSTDTLTTKTVELANAKVINVGPFPVATWGAAPVVTAIDTGVKLTVIYGGELAAELAEEAEDQALATASAMAYALASIDSDIDALDNSGDPGSFVSTRNLLKVRRELARLTRLVTNSGARNHAGQ